MPLFTPEMYNELMFGKISVPVNKVKNDLAFKVCNSLAFFK